MVNPYIVSPSIRKSHTGIAREIKLNETVYYFQIISRVEGRQGPCDDRAEQRNYSACGEEVHWQS